MWGCARPVCSQLARATHGRAGERSSVSHQAVTWAYEQDIQPSGAKFVLVTLANYSSADGYCYPSQATLARDTGQSERAVRSHIEALESLGLLVRERRHAKSGHRRSDGFWLVGFRPLPADSAARPPATVAARTGVLPATSVEPTGNKRQSLPADSAAIYMYEPSIEPSGEPSVNAVAAATRDGWRDIHWDTQVEIFGFSPTPLTPEHGRWNKAVAIWRRLDASPEDMRLAAERYVAQFPSVDFNAMALANRAESLLRGKRPHAPPRISDIRNPMIRSALTVDLSDIRAEEEAKRARRRGVPEQVGRPFGVLGDPRGDPTGD